MPAPVRHDAAMNQLQHASLGRDVVVIGAGPAGLTLACALADIGLGVTVLEQ